MNRNDRGVPHARATFGDWPTVAITSSSRPASWMVLRKNGNVSIFLTRGSTRSGSCHSHPAWFSSLPRWWSTANTTVEHTRAAAPSHTVERPQYEPTSRNGSPGSAAPAATAAS